MNRRKITQGLVAATVSIWIGWDVYVVMKPASDDATISAVVVDWSRAYPLIPLGIGVVCGHWFWSMKPRKDKDGT